MQGHGERDKMMRKKKMKAKRKVDASKRRKAEKNLTENDASDS